jgi:DNA modification methylase
MPMSPPEADAPGRRWRNRIVGHGEELASQLLANPKNWRLHPTNQRAALEGVLKEVGWVQEVIVNRRTGFVVDGHLRAAMAISAGEKVPIVFVDLSEEEEALILATLDPLSAMAASDQKAFEGLVGGLDQAYKALVAATVPDSALEGAKQGLTDEDAVPPSPAAAVTQPGELWICGPHRVLCGNAAQIRDVERLMSDDSADLVFTDPPYNVDYEGYTAERLKIQGDRMNAEQFSRFLRDAFQSCKRIMKSGASLYVCHASSWQREFQNALETAGFDVRTQIIWAKNTFAWGFGRYKFQHEPIFYCHVAGAKDAWYGDRSQSTLWAEKKPAANREHPTAKPVELIARALINSSKAGDIVADLFGGSGSTLIGCERHSRKARLMEIDPKYVDVIAIRYQQYSGTPAILDGVGRTFDEIASERRAIRNAVQTSTGPGQVGSTV